jgi:glycosyltransferase involved in cell wall biosynthesis
MKLVSIVIPHLGRPQKLQCCLDAIQANSNYSPFEIIVVPDGFPPNNLGVPRTLAKGVNESRGEFVAFLGNDCLPRPNWLWNAMNCMSHNFPEMDGLVALNDLYWHGRIATHWVASKRLLPALDGYFFWPEYKHLAADNELTGRCRKLGKYAYAEDAVVIHNTPAQGDPGAKWDEVYLLAWSKENVRHDRELLAKRLGTLGLSREECGL